MKIAVRTPNWLGDAVMSLPAVMDLGAAFPDGEVDCIARGAVAEVYRRVAGAGRVVAFSGGRRLDFLHSALPAIRRERYDLGIIFPPSFSSALLFRLGRVTHRVGFDGDGRGWLLTSPESTRERGRAHLSEEYRHLVRVGARLFGRVPAAPRALPRLSASDDERARARALLGARARPWVAVAPGAVYGATKRWPAPRFAGLCDRLGKDGATVVLTGADGDRAVCAEVAREAGGDVLNLSGRTDLGVLIALFGEMDAVVSNDSGAMHLAAAAGAPVVAIFGSTSPAWTGPLGARTVIVRREEPCAPCYRPSCPIGIVCLTRIAVNDVHDACRRVLEGE